MSQNTIKGWRERYQSLPSEAKVMSNYTKAMDDTEADLRARVAELEGKLAHATMAADAEAKLADEWRERALKAEAAQGLDVASARLGPIPVIRMPEPSR